MSEELMDGKDNLLEEIRQLKEVLKGVREERDYLFNKLSSENIYLQQENTQLNLEKEQAIKSISHYVYERDVLKQQLKDKDEKISKAIEYIKQNKCDTWYYVDKNRKLHRRDDELLEMLESNKED